MWVLIASYAFRTFDSFSCPSKGGKKWRLISKTEICTASCGKTELYINAWKIFRDLKLFRAIVSFTPPDGFW
jgi:hypothetical protein